MEVKPPNIIPSGIEPVDKILGGLESGRLYLVHGEAAGKSLFGIRFLIEGLKRGESGALVIRSLPEEAVRRFARLGYDCLEDVYSGRLVVLECSDEISRQLSRLRELSPLLRELEWLLGNARPDRLVIDPITHLLQGEDEHFGARVEEFASWAGAFGSTVLAITDGDGEKFAERFTPFVRESFRFELKETGERATRFLTFVKSPAIPPQAIEVDPTRGVFLLSHSTGTPLESSDASAAPHEVHIEPPQDFTWLSQQRLGELDQIDEAEIVLEVKLAEEAKDYDELVNHRLRPSTERAERTEPADAGRAVGRGSPLDEAVAAGFTPLDSEAASAGSVLDLSGDDVLDLEPIVDGELGDLTSLLDDLTGAAPRFDAGRRESAPQSKPHAIGPSPEPWRLADRSAKDIDATITARAIEVLLQAPSADLLAPAGGEQEPVIPGEVESREGALPPRPKDYNVLVIADDAASRDLLVHTLSEYTVATANDGLSALAKLISFKPDLILLDADLPIIDGFKVLKHIRSSLNVPIIVVSGSHVRSSDRILTAELGADYYLAKPFSVKELRQKARQLIARFRGIGDWILLPPEAPVEDAPTETPATAAARLLDSPSLPKSDRVVGFDGFAAQVEKSIGQSIDTGTSFSVVGCRLPQTAAGGDLTAARLAELVNSLTRETDLISSNPRNDLMILLAEADAAGARSFTHRMRERVKSEMDFEPSVWIRSFPWIDGTADLAATNLTRAISSTRGRRLGDRRRAN